MRSVFSLLIFVLSLSVTAWSTPSFAGGGGQDAGGGNVYEAEFKSIGRDLLRKVLQAGLQAEQLGFEVVNLEVAVREVQVLGTDQIIRLDDHERSAINSRNQRLIVFNNQTWALLKNDQKEMLVLHEYLRFVGVDDSDYTYTLRIRELLQLDPTRRPGPGHSRSARTHQLTGIVRSCSGAFCRTSSGWVEFATTNPNVTLRMWCHHYGNANGNLASFSLEVKMAGGGHKLQTDLELAGNRAYDRCTGLMAYAMTASPEQPVYVVIDPLGDQYSGPVSIE